MNENFNPNQRESYQASGPMTFAQASGPVGVNESFASQPNIYSPSPQQKSLNQFPTYSH